MSIKKKVIEQQARAVFWIGDKVERAGGPALVVLVNQVLPRISRRAYGDGYELVEDIPYKTVRGQTLRLDIVKPPGDGPFPVLVAFHGGAWVIGRKENIRHTATRFARRGYLTVLVQYRLGKNARFPACVRDVEDALRWAAANAHVYGGDGRQVGVYGDSAGGHLSAYAAVNIGGRPDNQEGLPKIVAAVHWYGVFDFAKFARVPWHRTPAILGAVFGQEHWDNPDMWAAASPRAFLDQATDVPPTLLFAAYGDPLYTQSKAYERELSTRGHTVQLKRYRNSIHGFLNLFWQDDYRDSMRRATEWFDRYLKPAVRKPAAARKTA